MLPAVAGVAFGFLVTALTTVHAGALLPLLTLTSLIPGSTVSGVVALTASADAVGLSSLQFEVSGQPVGAPITSGACVSSWDTRGVANGVHTVTAVGRDSAGNSVWAVPVLVTVNNTSQADTTPPTVAVSSPAAGASVTGNVTVFASAADNVAVSGVWFTLDGATVSAEMPAPQGVASWVWNTSTASPGAHVLGAVARDSSGNIGTSAAVTVTVGSASDTTAPQVSVTAPVQGAAVSGTITLSANASDNVGVAGVRFTIDGTPVGSEDLTAPFSVSWNTASTANGAHTVRAIARDSAGNTTTSTGITVNINNVSSDPTPPTVSMTAPAAGATVTGSVTVSATASDNVGVASVQFTLDGVNLGAPDTSAPFQTSWLTTSTTNGSHTLRAIARDAAGNATTSAARTVTVSNAADTTLPTVSVTAPAAGATVSGTVTVSASASDNVGVVGVRFTVDGAAIGVEDTVAPYQISWNSNTVANGSRVIRAVARDGAGNVRTSSARTVVVNNVSADTTQPNLTITAPTAGAAVAGQVSITASAGDNVGVVGVQFRLDGANLGAEDTSAPFSIQWNSTSVLNGIHRLSAVARDSAGNTTTALVEVHVRNLGSGVAGDLDGDGYPDLLFANASGQHHAWFIRASSLVGQRALSPGTVDLPWAIASIDDFDGDKKSDLLWQNGATGQLVVWFMDGTTLIGSAMLEDDFTTWRVAASGDLNGDGKTDIIWHHPSTGGLYAWMMDGITIADQGPLAPDTLDPSWHLAGTGDINGDGRADLIWQNLASGALAYWHMDSYRVTEAGSLTPAVTSLPWQLKAVADFDRNGTPDLIWQNIASGQLYIWFMSGSTMVGDRFLTPSSVNPAWQVVGGR
jgi:hypothetical protein